MSEESKEVVPPKAANPTVEDHEEEDSGSEEEVAPAAASASSAPAKKKKKKKSKSKKLKDALTGKSGEGEEKSMDDLSNKQLDQLMQMNPALRSEFAGMDQAKMMEMLKKLGLGDALTGMSAGGKNQKDMASYKFWQTQPVQSFDGPRAKVGEEGPIKEIDISKVSKEPPPMVEGYEWVTMDCENDEELKEIFELLSEHYVEDADSSFRFHYSVSFFEWALKAPGWRKEWHVGVRASKSRKLVAFISAIPVDIRIRDKVVKVSEVNFLCVHKKLRGKRLAPVLIKEITRRSYFHGIFQGLYTGGTLLPTPVATCRYYHRSLDWQKLYDVGFSPLPPGSTPLRQVAKFKLPESTITPGLRPMEERDVASVADLLTRYNIRFDMGQEFSQDEVKHWLLHDDIKYPDRVVYTFVVEDESTKKVTDFVSFYRLASTIIGSKKHQFVNAAYLYYYGTETAFGKANQQELKKRLNSLVKDALIVAKREKFDVMNALTLLENPLFLDEQLFGAGDGQLHYYLYNYRAAPIEGGLDHSSNRASDKNMGGIGVVML